jgi:hypothetical protein
MGREFWSAVEPFATGEVYVNHLDAEEAARITAAYSNTNSYARLVSLKNRFDPTNLFRLNQDHQSPARLRIAKPGRLHGPASVEPD